MPSVYNTVFGGNPVAAALPTYLALSFGVNTPLGWPLESNITTPAVAQWIDATATAPGLSLQFSDARQVSNGYATIVNNVAANTFSMLDAQGNTLASIASGQAWILVLADNTTLQGTWRIAQLGAGVSTANAAALAGAGLKAIATTLNARILIVPQAVNYTIGSGANLDRASLIEWTGGAGGTFSSLTAATLGSDWFCYIKNSGSGVVSFVPGSGQINGSASLTFNPNDSAIIVCDGTNFFSIGFGQSVASSFNFVQISLAGASGNVILTGAQLNRISYRFTGALAGNVTVIIPASIQQYWVDNETTGAFTLTISAGGAGTTVTVPQATRVILYCDGLNVVNAITSGGITFGNGTAASPSITFTSDPTTGLYLPGAGTLGFAAGGRAVGSVNSNGSWNIPSALSGNALVVNGAANSATIAITAPNTNNQSFGALITAGTTISDQAILVRNAPATATFFEIFGDGHGFLGPNATNNLSWNTVGSFTLAAPTSGAALVINGLSNQAIINLNGPNTGLGYNINFFDTTAAAFRGFIGIGTGTVGGAAVTDFGISPGPGGSLVIGNANGVAIASRFGPNGNVTINAPSSGANVTLNGIGSSAQAQLSIVGGSGGSASISLTDGQAGSRNWTIEDGNPAVGNLRIRDSTRGADVIVLNNAGNVTINAPSSGTALTVSGASTQYAGQFIGLNSPGNSRGIQVIAGTNSSDVSFIVTNAASTANYFEVRGDGAIQGLGPVAGALVDLTPDTGSFTGTLTGMTATVNVTCSWYRIGKSVSLKIGVGAGTSNSTSLTMTGLPAALQPTTACVVQFPDNIMQNNGAVQPGVTGLISGGTITFSVSGSPTGWLNSGGKGISGATAVQLDYGLF